jgi:hypothetical protein
VTSTRSAWLASAPVAAAGCLAAHWGGYAATHPDASDRAQALAAGGHGYLADLPLIFAGAVAALVLALAREAVRAARGRPSAAPPAYVFALVPPAAFVAQEHAERLLVGASWTDVALQPSFLVGLALQVPFGLFAVVIARGLLRAAQLAGVAFGAPAALPRIAPSSAVPALLSLVPRPVPALAHAGRGPPRTR